MVTARVRLEDIACRRSSSGTSSGPAAWSEMPSESDCAVDVSPDSARSCASISARARSRNAALSQQCLEPLKLQADGGLRRAECFGGARKTLEVGDQQEGLDGGDVERCCHYEWLSLVSTEI